MKKPHDFNAIVAGVLEVWQPVAMRLEERAVAPFCAQHKKETLGLPPEEVQKCYQTKLKYARRAFAKTYTRLKLDALEEFSSAENDRRAYLEADQEMVALVGHDRTDKERRDIDQAFHTVMALPPKISGTQILGALVAGGALAIAVNGCVPEREKAAPVTPRWQDRTKLNEIDSSRGQ